MAEVSAVPLLAAFLNNDSQFISFAPFAITGRADPLPPAFDTGGERYCLSGGRPTDSEPRLICRFHTGSGADRHRLIASMIFALRFIEK